MIVENKLQPFAKSMHTFIFTFCLIETSVWHGFYVRTPQSIIQSQHPHVIQWVTELYMNAAQEYFIQP